MTANPLSSEEQICARCGCYREAHGEGERCEPVGWTFLAAARPPAGDVGELVDHERGCEGRCYTCTCGYDDQLAATVARLSAENARLREAAMITDEIEEQIQHLVWDTGCSDDAAKKAAGAIADYLGPALSRGEEK